MAMDPGDTNASRGMSKAIYDQLDGLLSPAIPPTPPDTLAKARASWKQLAFAIAS